mgnify:CR=1 FL=1
MKDWVLTCNTGFSPGKFRSFALNSSDAQRVLQPDAAVRLSRSLRLQFGAGCGRLWPQRPKAQCQGKMHGAGLESKSEAATKRRGSKPQAPHEPERAGVFRSSREEKGSDPDLSPSLTPEPRPAPKHPGWT